ncbi:MAG: Gfo/Idh/MocA family oxidoreductase [Alphaproteobacteria bacterium]
MIRMGVLGAARITAPALLDPARKVDGVAITAIAARDPKRAGAYAKTHKIATVHTSYDALLADPDIDAIYNPLPNSHHAYWTIKALEAGKHVLCEKPLASNALEARAMQDAAERRGKILAEAFHWRNHPLAARMLEIIDSGKIGDVTHIEAQFCVPLLEPANIRWREDLAGGATMDTGCYTINIVRHLARAEPIVRSATARLMSNNVDRHMRAEFDFDDGRTGRIICSMAGWPLLKCLAHVEGTKGALTVTNPIAPQLYHKITIETDTDKIVEKVPGTTSYKEQLKNFVGWLNGGPPMITDPADGVKNMAVIDDIYRAAGMTPRRGAELPPGYEAYQG